MASIALLAPVPLEHLEAGEATCQREGLVAFGSRAWDTFDKLDKLRSGDPVQVFIYASHCHPEHRLAATWTGEYTGYVCAKNGKHPEPRYRPPSTQTEDALFDLASSWLLFWHVQSLSQLPHDKHISFDQFVSHQTKAHYRRDFVPEAPLILEVF